MKMSAPDAGAPCPVVSAADAETANQRLVAFHILALDVVKQLAALGDHFEQATARVVVFFVLFEMLNQVIDAAGKQSYLNFGRRGVARMTLELRYNFRFLFLFFLHSFFFLTSKFSFYSKFSAQTYSKRFFLSNYF